jgi:hypothetical protein
MRWHTGELLDVAAEQFLDAVGHQLLNGHLEQFKLKQHFSEDEVAHW